MPIARTPLVDDDGSGTTGTVIDNAWQTRLYDAIDAADAAIVIPPPAWLTFAHAAGNLSANTGAFTVAPANFSYQYLAMGKLGLVTVVIGPATTSQATAWVRVAWPPGFAALAASMNLLGTINTGTLAPTTVNVSTLGGLTFYPNVALSGTIPATAALYLNASLFFPLQ